ncbi:MAG: hypothetical protein DCC75_00185 [Proteobacteria bacterium]|nr:MAG: hypothetical protein DCC75_00185 [Pseudomonadota bacterium]
MLQEISMKAFSDQNSSTYSYTFVEHTADISLKVRAQSIEELFIGSARGMMEYIFGQGALELSAAKVEQVSIESADQNSLLVDWLSAIHTYSSTNYMVSLAYHIESLSETALRAKVGWAAAKAEEDIKAVTYSGVDIGKVKSYYEVCITFDI